MYDINYLKDIQDYVYRKTGRTYFQNMKETREDIMISCPVHKEGQERKPSCGFSKVDKENIRAGWFHCFSCGFNGDTYDVLKVLLGSKFDKKEIDEELGIEDIEDEYRINNIAPAFIIPPRQESIEYVSEKELGMYRYYTDYLKNRNISEKTADKYDIGYDTRTDEITFPIRDYLGGTLAVGRRSVSGKRYEYPAGFIKPLYGVYELPSILSNIEVWIVEGPFNLWSLNEYKKSGVALLGTGTRRQMEQLLTIDCKGFILALDGDLAGRKGNVKISDFLRSNHKKVSVACIPDNEDVNSMGKEIFEQMYILDYWDWYRLNKSRIDKEENNSDKTESV